MLTPWHPTERLVRYLASNNVVKEVGPNEYAASNLTHIFASENGEAMISHRSVISLLPIFGTLANISKSALTSMLFTSK